MLEKKGDGHITANIGSGVNLNGSYSPVNKLVLIANYHTITLKIFQPKALPEVILLSNYLIINSKLG